MVTQADIAAAHILLDDHDESGGVATSCVSRLDQVIALAEACADHAPENNAIINNGRAALQQLADIFGVALPGLLSRGEGRRAGHAS